MTLESTIAGLVTASDELRTTFEGWKAEADQALADALAAVPDGYKNFYVDQANGDDTAEGIEVAPLKSIGEAVERTPAGGRCDVYLLSNYHMNENITIEQKRLKVLAAVGVTPVMTFERYTFDDNATTYRAMYHFSLIGMSVLQLSNLQIVVPPLDGNWGTYPNLGSIQGLVSIESSARVGWCALTISYSDIQIPANAFQPLFGVVGACAFNVMSVTTSDQSLPGRIFSSLTDTAGTDPDTVPWLLTNLSLV